MNRATRSEKYFVALFDSATLQGAIERAAQRERRDCDEQFSSIPVDVFRLAKSKRIQISEDLVGGACEEGLLVPFKGGYCVRLRKSSTHSRKRFSLAHELGHTLFYKDEGDGPRHQIGLLNAAERMAEEKICNRFASALLMPTSQVRRNLGDLPEGSPSALLGQLDATARRFQVSFPALLQRLRSIELHTPGYLLLYLSTKPNPATGKDNTLRVESCVSLGSWRNFCIWRNRSAGRIGLNSALSLYNRWEEDRPIIRREGCFSFGPNFDLIADDSNFFDVEEKIHLSRVSHGKWTNEVMRVISASRLYAWSSTQGKAAYVISALTLTSSAPTL